MVIFVHMASVWVPFTSESKEAIADYDEIRKEIKLALQECGRRLGVFLRRRERAKSEFRRRNIFELYIEEVVEACARLKGGRLPKEKLKRQLAKIAAKRTQARSFFNVGMAKKFMQTVLVADALAELQRADLTTSLREIYYRTKHTIRNSHENTFDGQNESDPLIEDLEVTLQALREELHVRAENSGTVVGPLVLLDDGDRVDCTRLGKGGYSVPSIVEP